MVSLKWPKWLKRGGIDENGNLICLSWGLNCASFLHPGILQSAFLAPGPRSKYHDEALSNLADTVNKLLAEVVESRKDYRAELRVLLLEEGWCFCWSYPSPTLEEKSDDGIRSLVEDRALTFTDALTAERRQELFDLA
jgi:hypothetical protein